VSDTNRDDSVHASESAHVNINRFEFSERALSIIALVFSTAAFMLSIWAITEYSMSRNEYARETDKLIHEVRQLQIQVMDHNALLIREGLSQPTDEAYGPAGNLEYKPHKGK
jgi:hypothetical protein